MGGKNYHAFGFQNMISDSYDKSHPAAQNSGLESFDRTIIDSMSANIAVIDQSGVILETNRAWREFAVHNELAGPPDSLGLNYLDICGRAREEATAAKAKQGVQSVIRGELKEFTQEYPCITVDGDHWFYMRVTRIAGAGPHAALIVHENITPLKLAEELIRKREQELTQKSRNLEEVNTALRVLVEQRETDKKELEERVVANIRQLVIRYIEKLKETRLSEHQKTLLGIVESHLNDVISPFLKKTSALPLQLTPLELQTADLVKEGLSTKEIASVSGISAHAVDFHRKNIRKKLGLSGKKTNLRSYLISLG